MKKFILLLIMFSICSFGFILTSCSCNCSSNVQNSEQIETNNNESGNTENESSQTETYFVDFERGNYDVILKLNDENGSVYVIGSTLPKNSKIYIEISAIGYVIDVVKVNGTLIQNKSIIVITENIYITAEATALTYDLSLESIGEHLSLTVLNEENDEIDFGENVVHYGEKIHFEIRGEGLYILDKIYINDVENSLNEIMVTGDIVLKITEKIQRYSISFVNTSNLTIAIRIDGEDILNEDGTCNELLYFGDKVDIIIAVNGETEYRLISVKFNGVSMNLNDNYAMFSVFDYEITEDLEIDIEIEEIVLEG